MSVRPTDAPGVPLSASALSEATVWTLSRGLRVAFERRRTPGFAFDLRLPTGSAHDPIGRQGTTGVLEEWLFKGAAGRDARALQDAFDDLGVRRGGGVGLEATRISLSGLAGDLDAALALTADVLSRPTLPTGELPVLTDLARQDLEALQDSPTDRLAVTSRALAFPPPPDSPFAGFGHPASGTTAGLSMLTSGGLSNHLGRLGQAGSVLGLVADLEPEQALELVTARLDDLRPGANEIVPAAYVSGVRAWLPDAGAEQTHLSLTAPGVSPRDPDWLPWQVALGALSGGSASRLFHAVREERGLAYAVSASPVILGGRGFLATYAGSTPDRAPETLDVLIAELARLPRGLTAAEFGRARSGLHASVTFGAEGLRARAGAITRDIALFGRVRPLTELRAQLAALTLDAVNSFLAGYDPVRDLSLVTLGPQEIPHA